MKTSNTTGALMAALALAQGKMRPAINNQTNQHGKGYADLSSILAAVVGPLSGEGIATLQWPEWFDETAIDITTRLAYGEEWMEVSFSLLADVKDQDALLSAIAIGRRYGLAMLTGVSSVDAPSSTAAALGVTERIVAAWPDRTDDVLRAYGMSRMSAGQVHALINSGVSADGAIRTMEAMRDYDIDPIL